jgi:hypothetical protein
VHLRYEVGIVVSRVIVVRVTAQNVLVIGVLFALPIFFFLLIVLIVVVATARCAPCTRAPGVLLLG